MKRLPSLFFALLLINIFFATGANCQESIFVSSLGEDGVQRVEILAGEYFFRPNHIIAKVHVPLEIKIRKEGGIVPHNIVISEPEAGINISEAIDTETKTIRFTPIKTGTYSFYCDKKLLFFKSHREKGMEGTLEIVP